MAVLASVFVQREVELRAALTEIQRGVEAREAWDEEDETTVLEWMRDGGVVQQAAAWLQVSSWDGTGGLTKEEWARKIERSVEKRARELRLTFVEGQSGAGGAHSALIKTSVEKRASELRLTFVEGQSGAGGAHSALVKNGYSKKGLGVTSWDDKVAELNSFGMAGWRKVVYENKKAATIHRPSRIVKQCVYTHPVLGKSMSYSQAIAAAMAACKGQGTLHTLQRDL